MTDTITTTAVGWRERAAAAYGAMLEKQQAKQEAERADQARRKQAHANRVTEAFRPVLAELGIKAQIVVEEAGNPFVWLSDVVQLVGFRFDEAPLYRYLRLNVYCGDGSEEFPVGATLRPGDEMLAVFGMALEQADAWMSEHVQAIVPTAFDGGETQKIEPIPALNPYRNRISGYGNTAAEVSRELAMLVRYANAAADLPDLPDKSPTISQTAMLERVAYFCEQLSLQIDAALQKAEDLESEGEL